MEHQFSPEIVQRIRRCGVIAVLVIDDIRHAIPLAKALVAGGVDVMELTLRTPMAVDALRAIRGEVPEMLAGVGTILRTDQVDQVVEAGAAFGVAPGMNRRVVKHAQQAGLPFAPGVATPSDIEAAIELKCRVLKFFPAQHSGGVGYLTSINAPNAHFGLSYIPLGGLNIDNMSEYLDQPMVPAVGGSWLAPRKAIVAEDWSTITANSKAARLVIDRIRQENVL